MPRSVSNRQEDRSVTVFDPAGAFADTEWPALLGAVSRVERDVLTRSASTGRWRPSTETAPPSAASHD